MAHNYVENAFNRSPSHLRKLPKSALLCLTMLFKTATPPYTIACASLLLKTNCENSVIYEYCNQFKSLTINEVFQ